MQVDPPVLTIADEPEAAIKSSLKPVQRDLPAAADTAATASRLGTFPTFTRVTSRRAFTSMMETSSVSVLLIHAYLPSGVKTIQFGASPVLTRPVTFFALTS